MESNSIQRWVYLVLHCAFLESRKRGSTVFDYFISSPDGTFRILESRKRRSTAFMYFRNVGLELQTWSI